MPRWLSSPLLGYVAAVLFTVLAALGRGWVSPLVDDSFTYLTFFAAVVLTAWFGGLGPTLLTSLLSSGLIAATALRAGSAVETQQLLVALPMFVFCGVSIAFFSGLMRSALRKEAEASGAARDHAARLQREADEHLGTRRALEASEKRLRLALSAGQMGVWEWDAASGRVYWDDTQRRLFGLDSGEPISAERFFGLIHADDRSAIRENIRLKTSGTGGQHATEFRVVRPDTGAVRWIAARSDVQYGEDGRIARISGVNFDITEAKEAEQRLRESDRRKTLFLATLAHELRNPLAPIQTSIEIMRRTSPPGTRASSLDVIDRQVRLLRRLVDDLLELSRIAEGKIELRRAHVTLASVVDTALETVDPVIRGLGRTLAVELPESTVMLHGDPSRLAQILSNLLNNAAKFTRHGGRIALAAALAGDEVVIEVRDDGMGLAPEMLERIFEPFVQGDPSLTRHTGGLGIGLSLVRTLAEMHGGTVSAASDGPGRGARFTVRLPITSTQPATGSTPRTDPLAGPPVPTGTRVLVVDDNRDAADSLALLAATLGAETRVAYDGVSALLEAERFHPDAVFLDIGMPDIDGYAVARELRGRPDGDRVHLVAVTGWGQSQDRVRAQDAGFDRHFVKPIDESAVRNALNAARERRAAGVEA